VALEEYRRKRDFNQTPEPSGDGRQAAASDWDALPHGRRYCVQKHKATRMHLDFRLEHDGVLLSWAIPRGPSLDPAAKRLAVQTEDHPVDYGDFEGVIPSGYGAGVVMLWDIGTFEWTRESAEDFEASRVRGDIKFRLQGRKLGGEFALVHIGARGRRYGGSSDETKNWLLIKKRDGYAVAAYEALADDVSVKTGRSLEEIAAEGGGDPRARRRRGEPASLREEEPRGPLLAAPKPMLAVTVDKPFSRVGWLFELKYDGVRAVVSLGDSQVSIVGRSGRAETGRYPELRSLRRQVAAKQAILDGEIVVLDEQGRPSFERLQSRINVVRDSDVARAAAEHPATFVAFDLLHLDGRDLMSTELRIRKKTLRDVVRDSGVLLYADHVDTDGESLFDHARRTGVEGIVGKRAASLYRPGMRSPDWVKVKAWLTQTCVIVGYTAGRGKRREHLGALILAVLQDGRFVHCGQVGTGFDQRTLRSIREQLSARVVDRCACENAPRTAEPATWVEPELVCEVRFAGWTSAGILRHPAFLGLRSDLTPQDCVRERVESTDAVLRAQGSLPAREVARGADGSQRSDDGDVEAALRRLRSLHRDDHWEVGGRTLRLTNLDKVLWPADGITKRDMVAYYVRMAPYLLPYLRERPLSMQVFPDGITGKSFWRKDKPSHAPAWIDSWTYHGEKTKTYIVVNELATLAWVANAGVIDLHPWHSRVDSPDQPDWAVFDLDPFEPATFADVVDIAKLVKAALDHYNLGSAIKTSGQTGLQIYVPVRRGPDYDAVRGWVEDVARAIGRVEPRRITWEWTVAHRTGKIRIDYTQNIINKTLAAPYSLRPAPRAPVSTPIRWEELDDRRLRPDRWNIRTIWRRLEQVGDLFRDALADEQVLPPVG
jgi:bifunctional non-homologous end joining protein LigD